MKVEDAKKWFADEFKPLTRKAAEAKAVLLKELEQKPNTECMDKENEILKKMCRVMSGGALCQFCEMECTVRDLGQWGKIYLKKSGMRCYPEEYEDDTNDET